MRQGVVFDSNISRKVTQEALRVSYKVSEDELDFITKLYQAYKIRKLTIAPTIELFMKTLIFENIKMFQEKCNYFEIYPDENNK